MPRAFNPAACDTCRQRKVKCDEAQPVCGQCARASRPCSRGTLADADTARLFHSYMTAVAPWYDLGDARRHFGTLVPQLALREPLLFNAVLALAGMHAAQTGHGGKKTAAEFHGRCVRQLIALDDDSDLLDNGVALAATCLLRSYEILDEETDPNRHLQGAYSFASRQSARQGLLAAGFWNYLREDITFSLFQQCPLKLELADIQEDNPLHEMTLILGRLVNAAFGNAPPSEFISLHAETEAWYHAREEIHLPFSRTLDTFPRVWFLQDTHAAAMHYYLTACCILATHGPDDVTAQLRPPYNSDDVLAREDLLAAYAAEICGISFTAKTPSVLVNSFGPISYCAKHLRPDARDELVRNLSACKKVIGWPVQRLVADLRRYWSGETRARDS